MFNVNLLGAPGIQPETVDSFISYRNGADVKGKNTKSPRGPGIFSKTVKFLINRADWIGFTLISVLFIFFLGPGSKYLGISGKTQPNNGDIATNYKSISGLLDQIENLNENVSLQKLTTRVDFVRLKLLSQDQVNLLSVANKLQSFPNAVNRIYGDSTTVYVLSFESPWMIKNDKNSELTLLQNSGDLSFTIIALRQLISDEILHRGALTIEFIDADNYQMKFSPIDDRK